MKTAIETLRASAAQTVGTDTEAGVKLQRVFTEALIFLDVTAAATDVDDTLNVMLMFRPTVVQLGLT